MKIVAKATNSWNNTKQMQNDGFIIRKNYKEWVTDALHVLIWLIVFLIPYIFNADASGGRHPGGDERQPFLYLNTALNCFWVGLFYANAFLLIPRLVYSKMIALYAVVLAGAFGLMVLWDDVFFHLFIQNRDFSVYNSIRHNLIPFVLTFAASAAYKAITDKTRDDIIFSEKQSENLKTELSFLRSQISPHFLFNVMNYIVALVRLKSEELEPTVMKLSSLMQYMLYETDEEKVLLKNEVEYLHNYIDLQKMRFGAELRLSVLFTIQEDWHTIEPMLLIPFVENAFKHGSGLLQEPEIDVELMVKDNHLHFRVKNKFEESDKAKDKTSGIGLSNVRRRLELLYPGRHILTIDIANDRFEVLLHLILE